MVFGPRLAIQYMIVFIIKCYVVVSLRNNLNFICQTFVTVKWLIVNYYVSFVEQDPWVGGQIAGGAA